MDTSPRPDNTPAPRAGGAHRTDLDVDPAVATFLAAVRDEYREPLPSDVTSRHLRMILAEAAISPAPPALRDRWARRARRIAAVGAVKIALTATAAAAATGTGLAATGSLPDAAQTAVAGIAQHVGLTLPVPDVDTPGDRTLGGQDMPGIGEGGVPDIANDADMPGRTADAPGLDRDADGVPAPARDRGAARDDHPSDVGNAGGDQRGSDRVEEVPAPAEAPASGDRADDTPAADRPAAPAEQGAEPGTPAGPPADKPADEASDEASDEGSDEAGDRRPSRRD